MPGTAHSDSEGASVRDRLLDATIEIAGREGLEAVSYRSVAARAGVAHGMVRHYFGTRSRLLDEALRRAACEDASAVFLHAEAIDDFAGSFVPAMNESWERPVIQFDETIQAIRGALPMDNVLHQYDAYLQVVGRTLSAVGIADPQGTVAGLLFAALDGLTLQHFIYGDDDRTERILTQLRAVMRQLAAANDCSAEGLPSGSDG